jgi:hypothetical protein
MDALNKLKLLFEGLHGRKAPLIPCYNWSASQTLRSVENNNCPYVFHRPNCSYKFWNQCTNGSYESQYIYFNIRLESPMVLPIFLRNITFEKWNWYGVYKYFMNCQWDGTYYYTIIGMTLFHNNFFYEYNKIWTSFHSMKRMIVSELGGYMKFRCRCTYIMYESSGLGKFCNLTGMVNVLYRVEKNFFQRRRFFRNIRTICVHQILINWMDWESDLHDHRIMNMYSINSVWLVWTLLNLEFPCTCVIPKGPRWQMCYFTTFGHAILALVLVMIFWKF